MVNLLTKQLPCFQDINLLTTLTTTSTTSFLTTTTLIYTIGAGVTAGAGTRLVLQLLVVNVFKLFSFQSLVPLGPILVFLVTTSTNCDWVIYAPAAFLRSNSRLSGFFSGIEPLFPVTHKNHGNPLYYHRKLIGQKLVSYIKTIKVTRLANLPLFEQF